MSMRRSARLSKAASRISVASNLSFTSSLKDAPPLPNIADAWLGGAGQSRVQRPLSVSRFALPQSAFRDSVASSSLQPLAEESPLEPNRKSYVSFDSDTQPPDNGGDSGGASALQSYFDESGSSGPTTEAGGSLNDQLSNAIAEDGEEPDAELDSFLKGDSWDNVKWMKGALIGQGSFGSVFLALHAVTGELMAVKQVEVPSNSNSILDKKKESMVAALKREIDLLRDLQHENIVQYLGSNSDEDHFNIFLEYVPGGSVAAMLNNYGQLHEPSSETLSARFSPAYPICTAGTLSTAISKAPTSSWTTKAASKSPTSASPNGSKLPLFSNPHQRAAICTGPRFKAPSSGWRPKW